jgi:hypothetical protein
MGYKIKEEKKKGLYTTFGAHKSFCRVDVREWRIEAGQGKQKGGAYQHSWNESISASSQKA